VLAALAPAAAAAGTDSTRVFLEVGAGGDLSNQVFYEQTFDSTAFSGRVTVSDPESRVSAIALVRVVGARGGGRTTFEFANEARAGDVLLRNLARAGIARTTGEHGRVSLDVEGEARRDRSFGADRRDLRLGGVVAGRLFSRDRLRGGRVFARAEWVRGEDGDAGLVLFPDFDFVQAGLDADRVTGTGGLLSLAYALGARSFPDTAGRDYREHTLAAHGMLPLSDRLWLEASADGARRLARRDSAIGDRFAAGDVEGRLGVRAGERWEVGVRSRLRETRYDDPTATFFDSRFWRHALWARRRTASGVEVELRPEVEFARTPDFGRLPPDASAGDRRAVAGEEYDEFALRAELERFGTRGWWTLAPAVGRRDYVAAARSAEDLSSHSDHWFVEVAAFADRPLGRGLVLRASADARLEWHAVEADDAKSLSVAAELRVPLM
jgi:hypothetical protein